MKIVITLCLISLASLLGSCTTHVYPKTSRTVYRGSTSSSSPAAHISVDSPGNTTAIRPAE